MLKLGTISFAGKCPRHPRFNPEEEGAGAIRGGCPRCQALQDIYEAHAHLTSLIRNAKNEARVQTRPTQFVDQRQTALF
jgi:phage FluMu protein Com